MKIRLFALAIVATSPASPAVSQSVDAAVEVVNRAQLVGVTEIQLTDDYLGRNVESWKVVGACSNRPTEKVRIISGVSLNAKRVRIASPFSMTADRVVCITNVEELDPAMRSKLKIID